jgi:hypothetical protein
MVAQNCGQARADLQGGDANLKLGTGQLKIVSRASKKAAPIGAAFIWICVYLPTTTMLVGILRMARAESQTVFLTPSTKTVFF